MRLRIWGCNMRRFPEPIQQALSALSRLPGVGPKTALRYAYHLLKLPKTDLDYIARSILLLGRVKTCKTCFAFSENEECDICRDFKRDPTLLCVVEESRDIATIDATGAYNGFFHVLGGTLNPIEGFTPETLRIKPLHERLQAMPEIQEIILALSPDVHGEITMLYLARYLAPLNRKITRLARGLPIGASLEYADEVTLGDAIKGRKET